MSVAEVTGSKPKKKTASKKVAAKKKKRTAKKAASKKVGTRRTSATAQLDLTAGGVPNAESYGEDNPQGDLLEDIPEVMFEAGTENRYYNSPVITDSGDENVVYLADFVDCALREVVPAMEFPFYVVSKKSKKDSMEFSYKGKSIEISAGKYGLPTVYDKGVMIFIVSQLMEIKKKKNGEMPSKKLSFLVSDLLSFCGRSRNGTSYKKVQESLDKLTSAMIKTNLPGGKGKDAKAITKRWHFLESATNHYYLDDENRRLDCVEVEVSDWLMEAIRTDNVLTLSPKVFELQPLEQRIYELARKHYGQRDGSLSFSKLYKKSGSESVKASFKYKVKKIIERNDMPDYELEWDIRQCSRTGRQREFVNFKHRGTTPFQRRLRESQAAPQINPNTVEMIKRMFKGIHTSDIYTLAGLFSEQMLSKNEEVYNFESQFIGFLVEKGPAELSKLKNGL